MKAKTATHLSLSQRQNLNFTNQNQRKPEPTKVFDKSFTTTNKKNNSQIVFGDEYQLQNNLKDKNLAINFSMKNSRNSVSLTRNTTNINTLATNKLSLLDKDYSPLRSFSKLNKSQILNNNKKNSNYCCDNNNKFNSSILKPSKDSKIPPKYPIKDPNKAIKNINIVTLRSNLNKYKFEKSDEILPSYLKSLKEMKERQLLHHGIKIVKSEFSNNYKTNPFKLSNLNPDKKHIKTYEVPDSCRVFDPNKLPSQNKCGIKIVNTNDAKIYVPEMPENHILSKPYPFRKNPSTLTQISSLPGGVKNNLIKDDYKEYNKTNISYELKSRNDYSSKIDCLGGGNSQINRSRSKSIDKRLLQLDETAGKLNISFFENDKFNTTSISRNQLRNSSQNMRDLLVNNKTMEFSTVSRDTYNENVKDFVMRYATSKNNNLNAGSLTIKQQNSHVDQKMTKHIPYIRKHLISQIKLV